MTITVFLVHLVINIKLCDRSSGGKCYFSHFLNIWVFAPRSHTFVKMCFNISILSVEIPFIQFMFFLYKNKPYLQCDVPVEIPKFAEYVIFISKNLFSTCPNFRKLRNSIFYHCKLPGACLQYLSPTLTKFTC